MSEFEGSSDVLVNRKSLEDMIKKARLEGALGYITYLCVESQKGKFSDLKALTDTLQMDALSTSGAIATLLIEDLKAAGWEYGIMSNSREQPALQPS